MIDGPTEMSLWQKLDLRKLLFGLQPAVYRRCVSHFSLTDCRFTTPQKLRLFLFGMQLLRSKQKMYQLLIDSSDSFVYVCACICMQACVSVCVCVCVIDWGFLGLFKKS